MLPKALCFVDIETTGARPTYDKILEIGIVRVENSQVVTQYKSLFNPHTYISPFIEDLTGISQKDVESAPSFWEEKEKIHKILDGCIFVAHNVRFDYGFLRNEFKRCDISFSSKHFCTVRLSQLLYPQYRKHDLDALISRFNISCKNRHRAFDDAWVLWEFYQKIKNEVDEKKLSDTIRIAQKRPSRPINISEEVLDALPESPGVYIFYGQNTDVTPGTTRTPEIPLYIGKSVNIRDRVLSHFSNDALSGIDMQLSSQVQRIEYILTGGELGALFKESMLIKRMQPLYNRQLRYMSAVILLKKVLTKAGYHSITISRSNGVDSENTEHVAAVMKSKKQAQTLLQDLAKKYSLCQKLLGTENGKGSCFGYKLGWCKGACVGKELPAFYNIRFLQAFSGTRIKPWPFSGPIHITEEDIHTGTKEIFVVDKWCVLGTYTSQEEYNEGIVSRYDFDLDAYKILRKFLKLPSTHLKITEAGSSLNTYPKTSSMS